MPDQTYVPCPHCGHPYPMSPMQKELYRGRTLSCNNCAKTFLADNLTPLPVEQPKPWAPAVPRPGAETGTEPQPQPDPAALSAEPAPKAATKGWVVALWVGGGLLAVLVLLLLVLVPPLQRAREQANRAQCATHMRQLGQAMAIYATVNGGRFPDRIDRLLAYVPSSSFVCPSCNDTPALGQTPQAQAANLATPGHLSYVYVGHTYSTASMANASTAIVLYEPLSNHADGINVLYADGAVNFLNRGVATVTIAQIAARTPPAPVGPPATQPTTQAAPAAPSR